MAYTYSETSDNTKKSVAGKKVSTNDGGYIQYNDKGTGYSRYDSSGRQTGGGLTGTENWDKPKSSGGSSGSSGSSSFGSSYQSMQNRINDMYDKQQEAQLAQMRDQRDKAIGQINQQKAEVAPQYANMRNQADVTNAQNVQRLREAMAANGLSGSGENVSGQVALGNARQNALNTLNTQEQQNINDLNRRIADLNDPSSENALIAQLDAERMRALIDAQNTAYDRAYQQSRDSVADSRYDQQWQYQLGRDSVADNQWQSQFDYQKVEQAWRKYTYNNMSASEKAQLEWAEKQYGKDAAWRLFELQYNGELSKSQSQAELDLYKYQ